MNIYNFFVAHPEPNSDLDVAQAYPELRDWISVRGRLERCGGRAGKVIKFNEKKYSKEIQLGLIDAVELFSARRWDKDDCREILNCDFSAILSKEKLLLTGSVEKITLQQLTESFFELAMISGTQDYAYGYKESHAYGFGYAVGIHMVDEGHPLMWPRRSEAGAWVKLQWAGKTDLFIRDIYPVNLFSTRKISALPPRKRQALECAMGKFGGCETRGKFTVWALDDHELEDVRAELKSVELLASYCS
ncbi:MULTISPECIES: hypothetical protein [Pseudomonas]|jgi:hypothetical protein|uniref:hypothetical protein n=1 Tax=Pseudomonas TaxID=286 RepID=UPI000A8CC4F2|nr:MULTISPECIES: hypothetical protein [Pseudomonas]